MIGAHILVNYLTKCSNFFYLNKQNNTKHSHVHQLPCPTISNIVHQRTISEGITKDQRRISEGTTNHQAPAPSPCKGDSSREKGHIKAAKDLVDVK
jgi:hypothetical protein